MHVSWLTNSVFEEYNGEFCFYVKYLYFLKRYKTRCYVLSGLCAMAATEKLIVPAMQEILAAEIQFFIRFLSQNCENCYNSEPSCSKQTCDSTFFFTGKLCGTLEIDSKYGKLLTAWPCLYNMGKISKMLKQAAVVRFLNSKCVQPTFPDCNS